MQAAELLDDVEAGAQPQVEGVAENDLGLDVVQLVRAHRLHRAIGTHRLEHRGLDFAVIQFQGAAAGATRCLVQGKLQHVLDNNGWNRKFSRAVYTPRAASV
ncbi:hypothetical protein D3C84_1058760 [compost metagenome]